MPGVWVITVGVGGKSTEGAERVVEFGSMWRTRLLIGLFWLGFPVGGAV